LTFKGQCKLLCQLNYTVKERKKLCTTIGAYIQKQLCGVLMVVGW